MKKNKEYFYLNYSLTGNSYIARGTKIDYKPHLFEGRVICIVKSRELIHLKQLRQKFVFTISVVKLRADTLKDLKTKMFLYTLSGEINEIW